MFFLLLKNIVVTKKTFMSYRQPPNLLRWVVILILMATLSACTSTLLSTSSHALQIDRLLTSSTAQLPATELTEVAFFPQEIYQCGPAALATALNWSGLSVSPEDLVPQVFLPGRQGSLQLELLAATRRHGRIPYVIRPELTTLFAEIKAGNPVLVLQNLGLSWYARWHYAVVVGFDVQQDQIILRSGKERRHIVPIRLFERTWKRGGYWAITVTPPETLPTSAEEIPYLQAVAPMERLQRWQDVNTAYTTALSRWPTSTTARMGLGNSLYALHDLNAAAQAFKTITHQDPSFAPAFNNLAQVLAEQNRLPEAEQAVRQAIHLGGPLLPAYEETLQQILKRR